ncbi:integral membrane protein [Rutstroemia sp. NJR-2017a BBW]|nr:integral membrane protein [Rutstroemia sp. NJR-2017a BBW]
MGSGILTVALPRLSQDLSLPSNLLLWPASVYALTAGCTLLVFGTVADVVGAKKVWLTGSCLYTMFTLACGLAQTGDQLIAFRAVLGVAIAMCLPSTVSLTTASFERGTWRNIGFACMGMGQPLGYSVGLILGGVFTNTIGWRYGYYISAIINAFLVVAGFLGLPSDKKDAFQLRRLITDIDWVGAICISTSLGLLSYILAAIAASYSRIKEIYVIVLLVLAVILIPTFVYWVDRQKRLGRPALIPNSLWLNSSFTSTCVAVFFSWATLNAFQYFSTLFFQEVQGESALHTSFRFIPMVIVGAATNIVTGYLVDKVHVRTLVVVSAALNLISPLLMAVVNPSWSYWRAAFIAMFIAPLHPDVLFTVSNLIISNAYPGEAQSLAGGVFNAVSQIGNSVGLAVTAAIAASVTAHDADGDLEKGYRAAFWTMFGTMGFVCVVTFFGLRKGGKVGGKSD